MKRERSGCPYDSGTRSKGSHIRGRDHTLRLDSRMTEHILFVCTGNICRSPMAEGIARAYAKEHALPYTFRSAGVAACVGNAASTHARDTAKAHNTAIDDHVARALSDEIARESDRILVMTQAHKKVVLTRFPFTKGKVATLAEYAKGTHKDVEDPFGGTREEYEKTYETLTVLIRAFLDVKE